MFPQKFVDHCLSSLYFIMCINIYQLKQCKASISSGNEQNHEIFSVIGAVVIDIHQGTQTEKTLFFVKYSTRTGIEKIVKQCFFSSGSLMYINKQSTYDTINFII